MPNLPYVPENLVKDAGPNGTWVEGALAAQQREGDKA